MKGIFRREDTLRTSLPGARDITLKNVVDMLQNAWWNIRESTSVRESELIHVWNELRTFFLSLSLTIILEICTLTWKNTVRKTLARAPLSSTFHGFFSTG